MQIYLASFSILFKLQEREDIQWNNNTVSTELNTLLNKARELLCEIEHFVNATSNRMGTHKPSWYEKDEMAKILTLKKRNYLNNLFVKARFQTYVDKLLQRIKKFNLERNLEPKSFHRRRLTTQKPRKQRKGRNGGKGSRRPKTTAEFADEKTFIFTTKGPRRNRGTRLPGSRKPRVNQKLQWIHLIETRTWILAELKLKGWKWKVGKPQQMALVVHAADPLWQPRKSRFPLK